MRLFSILALIVSRTEGRGFTMSFAARSVVLVLGSLIACLRRPPRRGQSTVHGPACVRNVDDYFAKEVWAKVGSVLCVKCHKQGGDAEESKLILHDPAQGAGTRPGRGAAAQPRRVCPAGPCKDKDQSRLLVKVTGGLDHGGGDVLKPDSKGYLILAEFVRRVNAPPPTAPRRSWTTRTCRRSSTAW